MLVSQNITCRSIHMFNGTVFYMLDHYYFVLLKCISQLILILLLVYFELLIKPLSNARMHARKQTHPHTHTTDHADTFI